MSKLPLRGEPKAVAADFCQLINSPSTRKDNIPTFPMKTTLLGLWATLATSVFVLSEEELAAPTLESSTARLIGPLQDGTPPPPAPPKPGFIVPTKDILESKTVEQGGRAITVRKIKPIALPPPPEAPAPIDLNDPALQQRIVQRRAARPAMKLLLVGATVYHSESAPPRTLVSFWPQAQGQPITVWSSADFSLLSGLSTFATATGEVNSLMMMWSITKLDNANNLQRKFARQFPRPEIPTFPEGKATFQIASGDPTPEALASIQSLHDLYNNEHPRLLAAYQGRETARIAHEAEQKANPPQPKDIVLNYWEIGETAPLEGGAK